MSISHSSAKDSAHIAGRRPGQPAYSAEMAKAELKKTKKGTPRALILADRIKHSDRSRNAQCLRLGVNWMTLAEAERFNRWPIGAAGQLLRMSLGVAMPARAAS